MGIQINRRTLFAMRVVEEVAKADGPVSKAALSKALGISDLYVGQAAYPLVLAGILRGVKGTGGGYVLGRPMEEIDGAMIAAAIPVGLCPDDREDDEAMLQWRGIARDLVTNALQKIRFTSKGRKIAK